MRTVRLARLNPAERSALADRLALARRAATVAAASYVGFAHRSAQRSLDPGAELDGIAIHRIALPGWRHTILR